MQSMPPRVLPPLAQMLNSTGFRANADINPAPLGSAHSISAKVPLHIPNTWSPGLKRSYVVCQPRQPGRPHPRPAACPLVCAARPIRANKDTACLSSSYKSSGFDRSRADFYQDFVVLGNRLCNVLDFDHPPAARSGLKTAAFIGVLRAADGPAPDRRHPGLETR